ncbi:MAG TPA: EAL domain-containing protein, partial [Burkholderiales bacterium]|nr:EAL domain-containing protein [Burkholderiales bacterium]
MDKQLLERMEAQLTGFSEPVERLRAALEKDEFQLYCQPILELRGLGRSPLAEVLVRLREEERALMPPGEFLPVFEHFGMMPQLDRWVARHAADALARGGLQTGCLTVNVATQTLEDPDFLPFVAGELAVQKLRGEALGFEIDEADLLDRPHSARRFAEACRSIGVRVLVDGFGRRAVSFTPLKDLGVHFVKVDGAITRKLLTSELAQNKLSAIVEMSDSFGYSVVAECVESDEILERLRTMGVAHAQGFGIHEPRPL